MAGSAQHARSLGSCAAKQQQGQKMISSSKLTITSSRGRQFAARGTALALTAALATMAGPAFADPDPQATGASTTPAAAKNEGLEEIVVTAQFRRENLQIVPIAITAVTGQTMDDRNMTTLTDVANIAPNVTMFVNSAAFGKTNAAFIRGIGQGDFNLAGAEAGVGIYLDDVDYATTLGSAFDLFDLASVDIERGPQGTLQGKNSIGGAIILHSKQPTGDGTGYVEATLGDYSRRDFKAAYDMSVIPGSLFLRVSAFEEYRNGYVTRLSYACVNPQPPAGSTATVDSRGYTVNPLAPDYLQGNAPNNLGGNCDIGNEGGTDVRGVRGQLRWLINDKMENNFTAYAVDDNSEAAAETLVSAVPAALNGPSFYGPTGFNGYLLAKYGQEFDSRFYGPTFYSNYSNFYDLDMQESIPNTDSMHQWGFSDVYDWNFADHAQFKSVTAFLGYWTDFSDDQSNTPLPMAWAYNVVDHQQFTQEFRLTGSSLENNQLDWATGLFYYHGTSVNRGEINVALIGPFLIFGENSPAITQNEAVFGQATEHLNSQWDLTVGVRGTHEDKEYIYQSFFGRLGPYSEEYSHFDWKAALDYKITPDLMAYASASTGFRGGGFNERPFSAAQINEFQPEKLLEYEVGIKSDWFDHTLRGNVALFYGDYTSLQFPSQLIVGGIPYDGTQNIGGANIYGYEVELGWRPVGGFQFDGSAGFTGFKYKDLGANVGCQAVANPIPSPAPGENCIAGNPGYSDYPVSQPKFKANVGVAYAIPIPNGSKLTPRFDVTYQTQAFADTVNNTPGAIIPGHSVLNGRIQWDSADNKWSLAALGTNLANKEYYISLFDLRAFGEGMESGQPAPPREWAVNIKYKFQ
jgi:iron complex outermembrane recepter protein